MGKNEYCNKFDNVVTAAFYLVGKWKAGGSKGDIDFYSRMFTLELFLLDGGTNADDVAGAAHDLVHYILSRWPPDAQDLPIQAEAMVLMNLALADIGRYPGGNENIDKDALISARKTLNEASEALRAKHRKEKESKDGRR
jgi:hypothetical protein